jgi:hypothetical protein
MVMLASSANLDDKAGPWTPMDVKAGEIDEKLKLKVLEVILQTDEFVVYLDETLSTQWWLVHELPAFAGPVLNRVAELEAMPIDVLPPSVRRAFRALIAEGVARVLDEKDAASAEAIHGIAEKYIRARLAEQARSWYLTAALLALVFSGGIMGAIEIAYHATVVGMTEGVRRLLLSLGIGAIGAAFSLITRIGSFPADPAAGRNLHTREAFARILVGVVGAFVGYLAIGTKQFFPALGAELPGLLLVSFVAGTSERFVPNLVAHVESSSLGATASTKKDAAPKPPGAPDA